MGRLIKWFKARFSKTKLKFHNCAERGCRKYPSLITGSPPKKGPDMKGCE